MDEGSTTTNATEVVPQRLWMVQKWTAMSDLEWAATNSVCTQIEAAEN